MCGIYWSNDEEPSEYVIGSLMRRGPDHQQSLVLDEIYLHSTVLHMRGDIITPQPLISDRFALQWNGEIFGFSTDRSADLSSCSDTLLLFEMLNKCIDEQEIVELIMSIEGPFAFVIMDRRNGTVYFGRDRFGRRSLLRPTDTDSFTLCSLADDHGTFEEISASGIHKLVNGTITLFEYPQITQINSTIESLNSVDYTELFINIMKQSVLKRLVHITDSVTVLFSGGVDSLLIAAILCSLSNDLKIYLVNVAFADDPSKLDCVPDRQTGLIAFEELKAIFYNSNLEFVKQDILIEEYQKQKCHVHTLMNPNISVMDESIAMALWFAAKAASSKVLLVGMGADEQFGGYTRHASRFRREGYQGLLSELQMDVDRISWRNLGRDDRVISDHGVEARYPFLDEQVVMFSCRVLPLDQKIREGQSNKWIIRESLRRMGFSEQVSMATKRAIQFGARTAKMQQQQE